MSDKLEKAYEYCESVTKYHAKSFYFAAKFLPKHKQKAVYPIYAFCRHVDDEIDEAEISGQQESIAAVERWLEKLNGVYAGKSFETENPGDEKQNLVLTAWRDLLTKYKIPRNLPLELMQGVLQDTHTNRYENFDELYTYSYRVASTVGLMSSEILGYLDKIALEYAEAMGIAMQLTNILRDVKEDAAINRIYLPQEDLRNLTFPKSRFLPTILTRIFVAMMKFQIERARDYYRRGEKGIRLLEKDSRFTVLLAARIYSKILDEIEKQNYNVFNRRAQTSKSQKILAIPRIWLSAKKL
jgi:phytoene synthase